jgi:hypothetical protein
MSTNLDPSEHCVPPPSESGTSETISANQIASVIQLIDKMYHRHLLRLSEGSGSGRSEVQKANDSINSFVAFCKTQDPFFTLLVENEEFANLMIKINEKNFENYFGIINKEFKNTLISILTEVESEIQELRSESQEYEKLFNDLDYHFNLSKNPIRVALMGLGAYLNPINFAIQKISFIINGFHSVRATEKTRSKRTVTLAKLRDLKNLIRVTPTRSTDRSRSDSKTDRPPES